MAKKKLKRLENGQKTLAYDLELLTHKYSDYYIDRDENDAIREGEQDTNYRWYATKEVFYPIYKSKVKYQIARKRELHPIIVGILKVIDVLEKLKNRNTISKLLEVTHLDSEICASILAELEIKGYVKKTGQNLELTQKGKKALKEEQEMVLEETTAYVISDGLDGEMLNSAKRSKDLKLADKVSEDAIELKPSGSKRLRSETLGEFFNAEGTQTLCAMLIENLDGIDGSIELNRGLSEDSETSEGDIESSVDSEVKKERESAYEIRDILEIVECKKFYKRYICLFYKNAEGEEKILIVNRKYEIDKRATKLLDGLGISNIAQNNEVFKDVQSKSSKIDSEYFERGDRIEWRAGKTIRVEEHKRYFIYCLESAKKVVYIQSPWVRYEILQIYASKIESALKRGVKIYIKYGIKPRGKNDKPVIDEDSQRYLDQLKDKFGDLISIKKVNSHEKILIFDDRAMIVGSFNWLSFGGESRDGNEVRGETSMIGTRPSEIIKHQKAFDSEKDGH